MYSTIFVINQIDHYAVRFEEIHKSKVVLTINYPTIGQKRSKQKPKTSK